MGKFQRVDSQPVHRVEWFYLTRETDNNNYYKTATNKQQKKIECIVFYYLFHGLSKITLMFFM